MTLANFDLTTPAGDAVREKYRREGALVEREHIIKLLEPFGECEPSICGKGCRGEYRCVGWAYRHAIALIKGENK